MNLSLGYVSASMDARSIALLAGSLGLGGLAASLVAFGVDGVVDNRWTLLQALGLLVGCSLLVASNRVNLRARGPRALDWLAVAGLGYLVLAAGLLATVGLVRVGPDSPRSVVLAAGVVLGSVWFAGMGLLHLNGSVTGTPDGAL